MIVDIQNFPPLSPQAERKERNCRCSCQPNWNKVHNLLSRQMSVSLLLPRHFHSKVRSQYCSLPIISTNLHPFLIKVDEQISQWVKNSKGEAFESARSMSDTSDYFSSSPSNSKEFVDSDYESGQEWTVLPLNDLFSSEKPFTSTESFSVRTKTTAVVSPQTNVSANTSGKVALETHSITSRQLPLADTRDFPSVRGNDAENARSLLGPSDIPTDFLSQLSVNSNSPFIKSKANDDTRTRVKDDEGFIRRAACVCLNEDESKVMLITSKTDPEGWLIPGGGLEEREEDEAAAQRETWEEAGVKGQIVRSLGTFQSDDELTKKKKRTAVFVLKDTILYDDFPEATTYGRRRGWFSIEDAIQKLKRCKPDQLLYLQAL